MAGSMLGWELLLRALKSDIKKKEDIILMLIHYSLLKSDFKCYGKSENWSSDDVGSELLPTDWSVSKDYVIRYKRNADKFLLMSSHSDDNVIIFNLTIPEKLQISNLICNYNDTVVTLEGDISSMVPMYKSFLEEVEEKLISPLITAAKNHVETQTTTFEPKTLPHLFRGSRPCQTSFVYADSRDPDPDLRSVGRRDLDPFASVTVPSGILFDPFSRNRSRLRFERGISEQLPRGAVPPGARFDPFEPPDNDIPTRRTFPPDYDDMFS